MLPATSVDGEERGNIVLCCAVPRSHVEGAAVIIEGWGEHLLWSGLEDFRSGGCLWVPWTWTCALHKLTDRTVGSSKVLGLRDVAAAQVEAWL